MNGQVLRLAWYRFRTTFHRRRGGYLALVLLIGLVGGLAMGAVAAARRTQSSFPAFLASTRPFDLELGTGIYSPTNGVTAGYNPALIAALAHLPLVNGVTSREEVNSALLDPTGAAITNASAGTGFGSADGEYVDHNRVKLVKGRMADPTRPDEIVLNAPYAARAGLHIGSVYPAGFYSNAQTLLPNFGSASVAPVLTLDLKVVGIVVFADAVVQDTADQSADPDLLFTPALTKQMLDCCVNATLTGLQVEGGARNVLTVEHELQRALPAGFPGYFTLTLLTEAKTERAIKPEAIALGVFGGIAALAALLIAGQVIGRQVRLGAEDGTVLRALGADPAMTWSDGLVGVLGGVVAGALLAVAVAVALSPLAPIGPVRRVYPTPGVDLDGTVLGLGLLVLMVVLGAIAVLLAYRQAPHRTRSGGAAETGSGLARALAGSGLPPPALAGIRFAVEARGGRNAVPVRSAILGAALAVVVVTSTVVFGASLRTLVSHPALYGWNWDYDLSAGGGVGDMPGSQMSTLLNQARDVAAWSGVYFGQLQIDGQTLPVLGASPTATVGPPVLSGHGFEAADQVVFGASTLAALHKQVGDTVEVSTGSAPPVRLRIVGTAAMPAIGSGGGTHLEMGTGAMLSADLIPPISKNLFDSPDPGPNAILVRLRNGASPAAASQSLNALAGALGSSNNGNVAVLAVQRPAEIINYRSMGTTPTLLASALGAGAVVALGLTLLASVRRRRRDLALFKTLGFTRRQLAAVVAWQSSVAVGLGSLVGIPLGIVAGRSLWDLFAGEIHAVAHPTIPALPIVLIAVGGLVLANLVAAIPGRIAARTPTALILRAG